MLLIKETVLVTLAHVNKPLRMAQRDARCRLPCVLQSCRVGLVWSLFLRWSEGKGKMQARGNVPPRDRGFGVNRKYLQGMTGMPQFNSNDCAQQRAYVMLYDYIQFSSYLLGLPCHGSTLDNQSPRSFQGK